MHPTAMSTSRYYGLLPILGFLAAVHVITQRVQKRRSQLPLPPGPKKLPILGNLLDLPADRPWETYHKWSQVLNTDIIHLDVAGRSVVVVESAEAVRDLFETRSSIYSDRPVYTMLGELCGWDRSISFMHYGDEWRRTRRLLHESFNVNTSRQFQPQIVTAVHASLARLGGQPENVVAEFKLLTGSLVLDFTYGIKVKSADDPYINMTEDAMESIAAAGAPGSFFVDMFPILKYIPSWVPGAGFQRLAAQWRKSLNIMFEVPFAEAKRNIAHGTATPSFVSHNLAAHPKDAETICNAAGITYSAGVTTTTGNLAYFVFAMLQHPEKQKRAQEELDRVLGHGILPSFADKESGVLPYIDGMVKEVLRWASTSAIGVPHAVSEEDVYRGFRIPKGSVVIGNAWGLLHDEKIYSNPNTFNPDRFLLTDGTLNTHIRDPENIIFGFGRRSCVGKHVALDTLWMTIASILAMFEICKCVDLSTGREIEPPYACSSKLGLAPLPFTCRFKARSETALRAIHAVGLEAV
ncbi:hypothetical protein MKEN_00179200 [Mycena kentingensis (nom. inval.)]|nr:hypothetical protein MKEN_00179200 [Mycena kentingensis (nom. inval.)]